MTSLFQSHDSSAVKRLYAPDYIQHNPDIPRGREALETVVEGLSEAVWYEPGLIVAEGEFVAIHGRILGWTDTPQVVVDLFRIEGGRLAEHWDVLQTRCPQRRLPAAFPCSIARKQRIAPNRQKLLQQADYQHPPGREPPAPVSGFDPYATEASAQMLPAAAPPAGCSVSAEKPMSANGAAWTRVFAVGASPLGTCRWFQAPAITESESPVSSRDRAFVCSEQRLRIHARSPWSSRETPPPSHGSSPATSLLRQSDWNPVRLYWMTYGAMNSDFAWTHLFVWALQLWRSVNLRYRAFISGFMDHRC